jgi:drug/metabolite transporter (DMT)-like permease
VGALILFGCVQATMIGSALLRGERLGARKWTGLLVALAGLGVLTLRGASAPDLLGAALMALAGVAWGVYSLLGRGSQDPLGSTARNFLWTLPMTLAVSLLSLGSTHASPRGLVLAVASGAVASGLGYTVWYTALRGLRASTAAIAQLTVPVLAAAGAVALLGETVTPRLVLASALVLGGVALALAPRRST